jgi:predicted glycoside hydrolase/deacetylase ChbG (UPF0249 family)
MRTMNRWLLPAFLLSAVLPFTARAQEETFAEKLGWARGDRVVILHVDDAGMSHDSNVGAFRAIREGVASSMSVMMPCPWVPETVRLLRQFPDIDACIHLTLTSEWDVYRWGPLMGRAAVPGLVDDEGAMWSSVTEVVAHASADEVEAEIRAQIARARRMGFEPTHLDSHMGTLFATPEFTERYIAVGAETGIAIMFPGGHNTLLERQYRAEAEEQLRRAGRWREGMDIGPIERVEVARRTAPQVWAAGLPVLDDLHNTSYGWRLEEGVEPTDNNLRAMKTRLYSEALRQLRPGVTMVIMHCTEPSETFASISGSGQTRKGDLLAMTDPALRQVIEEEGLIVTTWRELKQRRDRVGR